MRNLRTPSGVLAVVLLAFIAAAAPAAAARTHAAVAGATYNGSQRNGFPISLTVSGDARKVTGVSTWIEAACSAVPVQFELSALRIRHDAFSGARRYGQATATISGTFRRGGRAYGRITWHVRKVRSCNASRTFSAQA